MTDKNTRSKKRSWQQGQKPKYRKYFKRQLIKAERQLHKRSSADKREELFTHADEC